MQGSAFGKNVSYPVEAALLVSRPAFEGARNVYFSIAIKKAVMNVSVWHPPASSDT